MRKIISILAVITWAMTAWAQTPQEIVARMEATLDTHEDDGLIMTVDLKVPILGAVTTKCYYLGEKSRMEARMMGAEMTTWTDGETMWTYNSKKNEIEIKDQTASIESGGDTELFSDIAEGYDIILKKETDKTWQFQCKKSKSNKEKDAPKSMDLVIDKGTYYPVSLSTKISGMTLTMRDLDFGVTDQQVSFDPSAFPDATVVDRRQPKTEE